MDNPDPEDLLRKKQEQEMDFSFLWEQQSFVWGLQCSSNFLSCEPHICSYLG